MQNTNRNHRDVKRQILPIINNRFIVTKASKPLPVHGSFCRRLWWPGGHRRGARRRESIELLRNPTPQSRCWTAISYSLLPRFLSPRPSPPLLSNWSSSYQASPLPTSIPALIATGTPRETDKSPPSLPPVSSFNWTWNL